MSRVALVARAINVANARFGNALFVAVRRRSALTFNEWMDVRLGRRSRVDILAEKEWVRYLKASFPDRTRVRSIVGFREVPPGTLGTVLWSDRWGVYVRWDADDAGDAYRLHYVGPGGIEKV